MSALAALAAYGSGSDSDSDEGPDSSGNNAQIKSEVTPADNAKVENEEETAKDNIVMAPNPASFSKGSKVSLPSFNSLMDDTKNRKTAPLYSLIGSASKKQKLGIGVSARTSNSEDDQGGQQQHLRLLPPQVQIQGRKNISTEDRAAWNTE
uniref:Uncharacterized protein n=1 Tax=Aplanochytrium stocchinoi TaxID=215587 RepID=A0A7S3LJ66_9STRA|mmetsp:Transcript_13394/g.16665  ORF Transcript_13394/g.16665 Transcript_13394/m.16665 type:complete len:151 (-) Transcript_13394:798-1250(-)|eukprot:CAMPEP_0204859118 /NCGR_PEP_ID=MMETSP1347-20130617/23497_1 /ASSEMBLY_ACC=CAM_ASM_000690 /TAXON_ID=215587 /ORGANISM="Aplanochytrium stocchinoi, Strain GSBS06" /LENGTH=150 /DNA_ID=CAMNT_0052007513 /DNA_START=560 /DNA_END=1012 /DNA_ORIENTATION=+